MISQTIAKPSFTKSKAYGLCGTLALATALLIGAGSVSADEATQPVVDAQPAVSNVYTADNAGNVTVTPSETVAPVETPKVLAPAPVESQPIAETPATTTETTQPVETAPTSVVKEGDTITVENPNVQVDFPNGTGKYSPFKVEYKDIEFPDSMAVNEGDKVVTELPKEIGLQTSFDFDVYNNENIVGKANADAPKDKAAQSTTVSYKLDSEPKEVANTTVYGGVLPNTGEKEGIMSTLGLAVIAVGIAGLTLSFKKYNERGEN
ncbi:LPXTG cell wall anchor domain-containing protein [Streptococcus salivarius]|uniref:LPXTG cell wall anchor domain-containing protein n=1 Tax=Streptococcus salivarius TaxID=1304 RepID=UPI00228523BB|nr:LPXTG cell wall anchor domain-containing protein [Streptococcus salivarius]MCY7029732.1 LPXTG cell wall anchor domain-containing protein [Streptococcus salivarius]